MNVLLSIYLSSEDLHNSDVINREHRRECGLPEPSISAERIVRRKLTMREITSSVLSRTTTLSPVRSVITVSGEFSISLIRSELTAMDKPLRRVSMITL